MAAFLAFSGSSRADGAADLQACYGANNQGDYATAVALCGRAAQSGALSSGDAALALNERGNAYNSQGDYDHAIESYDEAIKRNPDYGDAYFDRGTAFDGKDDYDHAIQDYSKAIALRPSDANAFLSRGQDYALNGKFEQAIHDYDQVGKIDTGFADVASWAKGQALFNLGRFPEATGAFQQYLKVKPAYAYGALWLYLAQARAKKDGKPALADRSQLLDLTQWPGPIVQFYLGSAPAEDVRAAAKQGDAAYLADQACETAFYIGEFNLVAGRTKDARRDLTQAAAICSKSSAERGTARIELGRM